MPFKSINKLFGSKADSDLLTNTTELLEDALLKTATETLSDKRTTLEHLVRGVLPGLSAVLASNFAVQLVTVVLHALVEKEHSSEIQRNLRTLIANPMRTGIDRLRIALKLEKLTKETDEEAAHRIDRYRAALESFDEAFQNASEEEKIPIHLYRAMASFDCSP